VRFTAIHERPFHQLTQQTQQTFKTRSGRFSSVLLSLLFLSFLLGGTEVFAASITWTGAVSSEWDNAANWSPNDIPNDDDDVTIGATTQAPILSGDAIIASLTISNGTLTVNGSLTTTNMVQKGGTLTGSGTLTAPTYSWTGGTMSGSGKTVVPAGGTMTLSTTFDRFLDERTLINDGSVIFSGAAVDLYEMNGAQIINNGLLDFQGQNFDYQVIVHYSGTVGSFINNGTVKKSSGTDTATIRVPFSNNGVVQIDIGALTFNFNDGDSGIDGFSGTYAVAADAALQFDIGSGNTKEFVVDAIAGEGTVAFFTGTGDFGEKDVRFPHVKLAGGTLVGHGDFTATSFTHSSGTLTGSGTLTAPTYSWTGGTMSGSGKTVVPAGGTMTLSTTFDRFLDERTLINDGSVIFSGAAVDLYEMNGAQITNNGLLDFQGVAHYQVIAHHTGTVGSFINNGTVKKSMGTDPATIQLPCANNGAVRVDSGTLAFISTLLNTSTGWMQGSAILNLVSATYTNSGTTQPGNTSPGKLSVTGNYPLPTGSTLSIRLGGTSAGTDYDQLAVSGNVTLGGALDVSLVDPFIPSDGDSFTLVTSAGTSGISGTFSKLNLPELPAGLEWKLNISETTVILSVNPVSMISASPLTHDFGSVFLDESSEAETFTLTNSGTDNLVIGSMTFYGPHADRFALSQGTCGELPVTLNPGKSCTVDVTFTPTTAELAESILAVNPNNLDNPQLSIFLAGTGLYKLTVDSNSGGSVTGPTGSLAGGEATFIITPNDGYDLDSVMDNGKTVVPIAGETEGTYAYTLSDISAHHVIEVTFVTTAPYAPGDCNQDGQITIAEVQSAINMYLGLKVTESCVDIDGSNNVSIAEVQKVINGYLGL